MIPPIRFFSVALFAGLFIGNIGLMAQENVSFNFIEGDFFLCVADSTVTIEIVPDPNQEFEEITLVWIRGETDPIRITDPSQLIQTFDYPSERVLERCDYPEDCLDIGLCFNIQIRAKYRDNAEPENISRDIIFRRPPQPQIAGADHTCCSGQTISLTNGTCPGNDPTMRYRWELPDGRILDTVDVEYTFGDPGDYTFTLTATNDCGTRTTTETVVVQEAPAAQATADSNIVSGFADPFRVCLDGSATIRINGEGTTGITNADWTVSPRTGVSLARTDTLITQATFTEAGRYTFLLTGENRTCGLEDTASFSVEVVESASLSLPAQPDACPSLAYMPQPEPDPDANYFIDGEAIASFPFEMLPRAEPYVVRAEKTTLCGDLAVTDTIFVDAPIQPTLTTPPNGSAYCPDTSRVELVVSDAGGSWTPAPGLVVEDDRAYFDRNTGAGSYSFTYTLGSGECLRTLVVDLSINDAALDIPPDFLVCEDGEPAAIMRSPTGVVVSGTGVNSTEGTFDPAGLTPGDYPITFSFNNAATGCEEAGSAMATIIPRPTVEAGAPIELCNADQSLRLVDFIPTLSFSPENAIADFAGRGIEDPDLGTYRPSRLGIGETDTVILRYRDPRLPDACLAIDTLLVAVTGIVAADAGADTTICGGGATYTLGDPRGGRWEGPNAGADGTVDLAGLSPDTYTYTLVLGAGICESRDEKLVTVAAGDGVDLAEDRLYVCDTALTVALPVASPLTGGAWQGDLPIVGPAIDVAGALPGAYDFTYTVADLPPGCNAASLSLELLARPSIGIEGDTVSCAGGACTEFRATGDLADRYQWFAADGLNQTTPEVCHGFAQAGDYTVTLEGYRLHPVTNSPLCAAEPANHPIRILAPPPPATILASQDSICPGETITFELANSSSANLEALSYDWDFGIDTFAGSQPVPLEFPSPVSDTTYLATLTTQGGCGSARDTFPLVVRANPIPGIGVVYDEPCSGGDLIFTNLSTGTLDRVRWQTSDLRVFNTFQPPVLNPTTGAVPSNFGVSLIVSNSCGVDTASTEVTVNPTDVRALLNFTDTTICVADTFVATNISTPGAPIEFVFADGNRFADDTLRRSFPDAGLYEFTLFAYGCGFDSSNWRVRVLPLPALDFDAPNSICPGEEFTYQLSSTAASTLLNFGDGSTSDLNVGSHQYNLVDTSVLVDFAVTDLMGCTADSIHRVAILPQPEAVIEPVDTACAGQSLTFTGGGNGGETCRWLFGDGESGAGCQTDHTFAVGDRYVAQLVYTSDLGCQDTASLPVFVRATPEVALTADYDDTRCGPTEVSFTFSGDRALMSSYSLDFDDGSQPSTVFNPTHRYERGGIFEARLTVGFDDRCFSEASTEFRLREWPRATAVVTDERCLPEDFLVLEVLTENPSDAISLFGDNYFQNGIDQFELNQAGNYELEVVSTDGCDTTIAVVVDSVQPLFVETIDDQTISFGDSVRLATVVNARDLDFYWTNGTFLSDATAPEPWARPFRQTEFVVTASDSLCAVRDTVVISVDSARVIYTPTSFSPNGDGINDEYIIFPSIAVARVERFQIFDRWGSLVHLQTTDFGLSGSRANWDGTSDGRPLNPGVFVYLINYLDAEGIPRLRAGSLTLVR